MYVERLDLSRIRTFSKASLEFIHPDQAYRPKGQAAEGKRSLLPKPKLPNVNLLLGDNGSGKSTVLRAVAMAALGPAFVDSKLPAPGLERRRTGKKVDLVKSDFYATMLLHEQDSSPGTRLRGGFGVSTHGELERLTYFDEGGELWNPVYSSDNDAFFAVGYGATRRVELPEKLGMPTRSVSSFTRAQRVESLFQESFALIPLSSWLPQLKKDNPGRYTQVDHLINRLLKPARYTFTGEQGPSGDYMFEHGGLKVPFRALSDGYRSFIGWVADMLFHVCFGCPSGKKLVENSGIVMVDEIDLHLHPRWQMKVIPTIAKALPRVQFVLTSHSPLVASSLEWMNIQTLKLNDKKNESQARRLRESIHGLDADQVLVSSFFGLSSTRAAAKTTTLDALTLKARRGDDAAARRLIAELASGTEDPE